MAAPWPWPPQDEPAAPQTEYERQRQANIERNQQMLAAIRAQAPP